MDNETVIDLKERIFDKIGIPVISQRLVFRCKTLEDSKKRNECIPDIDYVEIELLGRLRGGSIVSHLQFVDLSSSVGPTLIPFGKGPDWVKISQGFNVSGICINSKCVAHLRRVISAQFIGVFDMSLDLEKITCPICKKFIKPRNCYFWDCKYRFWGIQLEENSGKTNHVRSEWETAPSDKCTAFLEEFNGIATWLRLVIETDD
ncbi:hypothetical protein HK096_000649 [Nowakowskiella sp. JEL0078]|nr:hypothetical protein HK096_000649 [Nowakowskiella sp. JEL0078]